jgi:cytochrome c biogenesis protein
MDAMDANDGMKATQPLGAVGPAWSRELLRVVADLRLAIVLLLVIAVASIAGTVIEQGQSIEFYKANYPEDPALFGFLSWKVLLALGLDAVYRTWWYLGLLVLFGASLAACTFMRQWPALKAAHNWSYYRLPRQFEKLALSARLDLPEVSPEAIASAMPWLKTRGYRVFADGAALYARKGIAGRIGPIIVHAGMLIVLVGAIVGALTGFIAQELVPSGQTFQVQNIIDGGPLAAGNVPRDWSVKVNRFWIDYLPDGNIDQFYSDLSVIDQAGQERDRQTIYVNKPLRYRGVTMYQTDWGIAAVRVRINNSPKIQLPMGKLDLPGAGGRIWGTWVPTKPDMSEGVSLLARDLQGAVLIYDAKGRPIATTRVGRSTPITLGDRTLTLAVDDLIGSTGLQIKADPSIPIVYLGFGLLMVGVVMSYFSHSQIWLLQEGRSLYVGGRTNRAQVAFEREMLEAIAQLRPVVDRPAPSAPASPNQS